LLLIAALLMLAPVCAHAGEPLDLKGLLAEAEANNPELKAFDGRVLAAKERPSQAGALDDPMLSLGFTNATVNGFSFDAEPMTMKEVGLSQKVPSWGKRPLMRKVSEKDVVAIESSRSERSLSISSEVKSVYYELYAVKKSNELLDKNIELMKIFKKVAETGYSVGKTMMKDVLKAQVELTTLLSKKVELTREERMKRAYLGALLGRCSPVDGPVADITPTLVDKDSDALRKSAFGNRPAIRSADAMVERSDVMLELARKRWFPDYEFALRYGQRDTLANGTAQSDMISGMVTINLPVWWGSKLEPALREAAFEKSAAEKDKDAVKTEICYRIDSFLSEIEQDDRIMKLYKDALIPQATEDLDNAVAGYEVGRADFLTLLDSRRALYDYELGYYTTLAERENAVAGLEAAVGTELK